jgi:hypothetical protein
MRDSNSESSDITFDGWASCELRFILRSRPPAPGFVDPLPR